MKTGGGKTVWQRTTNADATDWSRNRKVFAYADCSTTPYKDGFKLFFWKPGRRIKKLRIPPLPNDFGEGIFPHGLRISPDGKHALLLVAATQGDLDIGMGSLLCVDTATGYYNTIELSTIDFHWNDSKHVSFTQAPEAGALVKLTWKLPGTK